MDEAAKEGEDRITKDKKDIEDYDAIREKLLKEELDLLALKLNATVRIHTHIHTYIHTFTYVHMHKRHLSL